MITLLEDKVTLGDIPRRQLEAVMDFLGTTTNPQLERAGLGPGRAEMVRSFYFEVQELMEGEEA